MTKKQTVVGLKKTAFIEPTKAIDLSKIKTLKPAAAIGAYEISWNRQGVYCGEVTNQI